MAVAIFHTRLVEGEVVFKELKTGTHCTASFSKLPAGEHGFHIHKAGDLRGEGCKMACDHFHMGEPCNHGGPPPIGARRGSVSKERHTGDLGNIVGGKVYEYLLKDVKLTDLWGRSVIVHADKDDYGLGGEKDSLTTGHSGKRIACAVIGRIMGCD